MSPSLHLKTLQSSLIHKSPFLLQSHKPTLKLPKTHLKTTAKFNLYEILAAAASSRARKASKGSSKRPHRHQHHRRHPGLRRGCRNSSKRIHCRQWQIKKPQAASSVQSEDDGEGKGAANAAAGDDTDLEESEESDPHVLWDRAEDKRWESSSVRRRELE